LPKAPRCLKVPSPKAPGGGEEDGSFSHVGFQPCFAYYQHARDVEIINSIDSFLKEWALQVNSLYLPQLEFDWKTSQSKSKQNVININTRGIDQQYYYLLPLFFNLPFLT
jgi:hypothetical protein